MTACPLNAGASSIALCRSLASGSLRRIWDKLRMDGFSRTIALLYSGAIILALGSAAYSANSTKPPTSASADSSLNTESVKVDDLRTLDAKKREEVFNVLNRRHAATVLRLEALVRDTIANHAEVAVTASAIELLGDYRAANATNLLVQHLDFAPGGQSSGLQPMHMDQQYPCIKALAKIGLPALKPLIENVKTSGKQSTILLSSAVLLETLGPDLAADYVQREIKAATDDDAKFRMGVLLATIKEPRLQQAVSPSQ
jgi:hypothetical protein